MRIWDKDCIARLAGRIGLSYEDVTVKSRKRAQVDQRRAVIFVLRKVEGWTFQRIAEGMNIDHSTAIHHVKECEALMKYDADLYELVNIVSNGYREKETFKPEDQGSELFTSGFRGEPYL